MHSSSAIATTRKHSSCFFIWIHSDHAAESGRLHALWLEVLMFVFFIFYLIFIPNEYVKVSNFWSKWKRASSHTGERGEKWPKYTSDLTGTSSSQMMQWILTGKMIQNPTMMEKQHWMCSKLGLYMPLTLLNKVLTVNNNCLAYYLVPSNKKKVLNKGKKYI